MKKPANQILVIFGASGDLTKRKLLPALFKLHQQDLLPKKFAVLGASRTPLSDENFRNNSGEFIKDKTGYHEFKNKLFYEPISPSRPEDFKTLRTRLEKLGADLNIERNYIFYLSTPPSLYEIIPQNLANSGLNREEKFIRRLIIEKPFGTDLESAKELNINLLNYFQENQLYRIDHYLGKESVQNLLVTRFSNGIFEPLWNRNFIDRVEITSAEQLGVEGRGGYYDNAGALRDMLQNHLMQLVGFVAMEPPVVIEADAIRNEIVKVFKSIRPLEEQDVPKHVIRGQYIGSKVKGQQVQGYREETGVPENSKTETFVSLKFYIDNWRWGDVPFYIRTGKKLPARVTEIVIHFKQVPHLLFSNTDMKIPMNNQLIIRIQPDEGILLKFGMKTPGSGFRAQTVNMDFHYSNLGSGPLTTAYERLLLDCMLGDATLYARGDAVEEAWRFVQPVLNAWKNNPAIPVYGYPAGSWGPENSDKFIKGGPWRQPCKNLTNDGTYCEL